VKGCQKGIKPILAVAFLGPGCSNSGYKNKTHGLNVTFHLFLKLKYRKKEWLVKIHTDRGKPFGFIIEKINKVFVGISETRKMVPQVPPSPVSEQCSWCPISCGPPFE